MKACIAIIAKPPYMHDLKKCIIHVHIVYIQLNEPFHLEDIFLYSCIYVSDVAPSSTEGDQVYSLIYYHFNTIDTACFNFLIIY